jgi:hypothetical protein
VRSRGNGVTHFAPAAQAVRATFAGGAGPVETPLSYTWGMANASTLEDWRGVDVGQIQQQLRLSVSERVEVMVDAANRIIRMQECAQQARKLTDS